MVRVMLWVNPRSCSTVLERAISQMENCDTLHEPFEDAYYRGPERTSKRHLNIAVNENYTYQEALQRLANCRAEHVFAKELALCVTKYDKDILLDEKFRGFKHVFLTRHPAKSTVSYYKLAVDKEIGWNYFDKLEVGHQQLHEMYTFVKENLDDNPPIFRSEDLLVDPVSFLKRFCAETGLPFSQNMLSWQPDTGVCAQFDAGWHMGARMSTTFSVQSVATVQTEVDLSKYPGTVKAAVDFNMPYYELLKKQAIKMNDF